MKNVLLCSPVFLCTRHRAKLRREVTPPMKNIKMLIKSLLFQRNLQTWPYYLFIYYLTVYVSKFTQIMVNLIIYLDFGN